MCFKRRKVRERISLLVPFETMDPFRIAVWAWLAVFWKCHIPNVQIVVGRDHTSKRPWWDWRPPLVFSKTNAINDAFRRSNGDVIVIVDADVVLNPRVIRHCAERLRVYRKNGIRRWFMPYDKIYRLTQEVTDDLLLSDPCNPLPLPPTPRAQDVEGYDGSGQGYGALIQIMPREALELVEGADPRFVGWGGEDASLLHALDTLWGPFKETHNPVWHLWHPRHILGHGKNFETRIWEGQESANVNNRLASAYRRARGDRDLMQALVDQGNHLDKRRWWNKLGA